MEHGDRFEASLTDDGRYRLLIDAVTDYAIYMLDPTGTVVSWNTGAQRFKGYTAAEIIGSHFSRFYVEEDRQGGLPQHALEVAARDGKFESEGWRVRKDGSRFWASVVIDPIRGPSGKHVGFAKITRDLTERREAQRALEEARRTLFQSQKMEALGQLTGGVAHDFNNLLTAVLGSLELVRKRLPDDPRIVPLVDNAIQAAQRGASLTRRMLAFARRQELDREPIDFRELVRGMTDLLQRSLGPSIAIEARFPLTLAPVLADANQLEMVLLNLAVNARDAMPEGGPITIAAREENVGAGHASNLGPGRYVCLSVTDAGEGMDESTLARAPEPFFTTKGVGRGTGLGLSMVHGVMEQTGGRLMLRSRQGEGTVAELWLPAMADAEDAIIGKGAPAALGATNDSMTSLVVLAVDDDALILMNTCAMLEDLGHTALRAMSGKRALEILNREKNVDLVITDQAMPNMTGVQLIGAMRGDRPDLPIILASGYADLPPGVTTGMTRLAKPFLQQDLVRVLAEAMRPKPSVVQVLKFRQH